MARSKLLIGLCGKPLWAIVSSTMAFFSFPVQAWDDIRNIDGFYSSDILQHQEDIISQRGAVKTSESNSSQLREDEIKERQAEVRKNPRSPDAHLRMADTYRRFGRYADSIEAYKKVIRIRPNYAEAHFGLAEAYYYLALFADKPQEFGGIAAAAYKEAIRIKPDFPEAHLGIGKAYSLLERLDEAIEEYVIAIRMRPTYADAFLEIGHTYMRAAREEERRGTNQQEIISTYGKDIQMAIDAFKRVASIVPNNELAYFNLGRAYALIGRYDEAINAFMRVIQMTVYGKWGEAYFALCDIYRKSGRLSDGVKTFKQMIQSKPDGNWGYYSLGMMYLYLGDKGAALEQYRIMKSLKSGDLADSLFKEIYK